MIVEKIKDVFRKASDTEKKVVDEGDPDDGPLSDQIAILRELRFEFGWESNDAIPEVTDKVHHALVAIENLNASSRSVPLSSETVQAAIDAVTQFQKIMDQFRTDISNLDDVTAKELGELFANISEKSKETT